MAVVLSPAPAHPICPLPRYLFGPHMEALGCKHPWPEARPLLSTVVPFALVLQMPPLAGWLLHAPPPSI